MKNNLEVKIKEYIKENDNLDEINTHLYYEFPTTITAIFKSLYALMKEYNKNQEKIANIFIILKEHASSLNNDDQKILLTKAINLRNQMTQSKKSKTFSKDAITFLEITLEELNDILSPSINNPKIKYLEYLIFEIKNLTMINDYLKDNTKALNYKNREGDNIFSLVLKKYAIISTQKTEELDYYFQVILTFLKSQYQSQILNNIEKYTKIIKEYKQYEEERITTLENILGKRHSITLKNLEESYHIKFDFPDIIIRECQDFIKTTTKRQDLTYQKCITMDGKKALCLDDAIYIEPNNDGTYTLYIHITDIPSIIPYDSLTNKEARKRGETLYLKDRIISLYPEMISNNISSLLPQTTKNVLTYIFKLDPHYNIIWNQTNIIPAVINVTHKMTYQEVDQRIQNPQKEELDQILFHLTCFAEKSRKTSSQKELYREYENIINAQSYHESMQLGQSIAANIVHESAILVNYISAKKFMDKSLPYLFRKVSLPSNEFINEIVEKMTNTSEQFKIDDTFLNKLKCSYIKGIYTDIPSPHDGLKKDCYSHSTSPGRRYADSECQYAIYDLLLDPNLTDTKIKMWEYRINQTAAYLNSKKEENDIFSNQYNYLAYKKLIKKVK